MGIRTGLHAASPRRLFASERHSKCQHVDVESDIQGVSVVIPLLGSSILGGCRSCGKDMSAEQPGDESASGSGQVGTLHEKGYRVWNGM